MDHTDPILDRAPKTRLDVPLIRLQPGFAAAFERHINRTKNVVSPITERGLLLGSADLKSGHIVVSDYEPCAENEPEALAAAKMRRRLQNAHAEATPDQAIVIGFYKIGDLSQTESFTPAEVSIARTHFAGAMDVFLAAKPGESAATVFIWRNQELRPHGPALVFQNRKDLAAASALRSPSPPVHPVPASPLPVAPKADSRAVDAVRLLAAIVVAVIAGAVGLRYLAAPKAQSPEPPVAKSESSSLGLAVSMSGQDMQVRWNPESAALSECRSAKLTITEGGSPREFTLSAEQIRNGSVMYHRESDMVEFRLDATRSDGSGTSQTIVALGRAPAAALPREPSPAPDSQYIPPEPVKKIAPTLPPNTKFPPDGAGVSVSVKVTVNERGAVVKAITVSRDDPDVADFNDAAEEAARLWKFTPARVGASAVRGNTILNFKFAPPPR